MTLQEHLDDIEVQITACKTQLLNEGINDMNAMSLSHQILRLEALQLSARMEFQEMKINDIERLLADMLSSNTKMKKVKKFIS